MEHANDTYFGEVFSGDQWLALVTEKPFLWDDVQILWGSVKKEKIKTGSENSYIVIFLTPAKEKIIGLAKIVSVESGRGEVTGTVHSVIVHEDYRGQGLGKKLMNLVLEHGQKNNFRWLELTSRPFRVPANALYKKIGFQLQASAVGENGTNFYRYFYS